MPYSVQFEPPTSAIAGLVTGKLHRVGALIKDSNTGRIVHVMRESGAVPSSSTLLAQGLPGQLQQALGLACPAVSMLNLGATVAFGAATLHKLNKIDKKLDQISEKLDVVEAKIDELSAKVQKIAWAVDVGFASTLRALGILERFAEADIIGQLTAGAQAAWSCQFLEPGGPQRMMRIEHALSQVGAATERLAFVTYAELEAAREGILKSRTKKPSLKVGDDVIKGLMRLRQLSVACSIRANIMAETGDLYAATALTKGHSKRLNELLTEIGKAYLNVGKFDVYRQLISPSLADSIPTSRLDYWTNRFDPEIGGAFGLMDALRRENAFGSGQESEAYDEISDPIMKGLFAGLSAVGQMASESKKEIKPNKKVKTAAPAVIGFFDLMDSCWEDVDRLSGYALEMEFASNNSDSWQSYRESLMLDHIPDEANLAFFTQNESATVPA